jgi:hypothetical protein
MLTLLPWIQEDDFNTTYPLTIFILVQYLCCAFSLNVVLIHTFTVILIEKEVHVPININETNFHLLTCQLKPILSFFMNFCVGLALFMFSK